ncbi:hypothetical protein X975_06675, partial [Stegodyphus mimosarum]
MQILTGILIMNSIGICLKCSLSACPTQSAKVCVATFHIFFRFRFFIISNTFSSACSPSRQSEYRIIFLILTSRFIPKML